MTSSIIAELSQKFEGRESEIKAAVRSLNKALVRKRIIEDGVRIDGRGTSDIRPLHAEVDLIPDRTRLGLVRAR